MKQLKQPKFVPKTSIEDYYNNDFHIFQIGQINRLDEFNEIEPLDFLNLFFEKVELVKINKKKPLTLAKHLTNLDLNKSVLYFFIDWLIRYINFLVNEKFGHTYDHQLIICRREIDKEFSKIFPPNPLHNTSLHDHTFDFDNIKADVDKIDDIKEKIKFLTVKRTEFLQKYGDRLRNGKFITLLTTYDAHFLRKCDLELDMLKELSNLKGNKDKSPTVPFKFENKFDNVDKEVVYNHFRDKLVESDMLSEESLKKYLIMAFQDTYLPKEKFKLERKRKTKADIISIFHEFYKNSAGSPRGEKKDKYIRLLSDYFSGYDYLVVRNNFRS